MENQKPYQNDFNFVSRHIPTFKDVSQDSLLFIIHKVTRKMRKYNHSDTHDDFKYIYIKYYVDGHFSNSDFDEIIKDGAFHKFDFELCKSFFLEVYCDNSFLMKKFESNNYNYFKNNQDYDKYNQWLVENFTKSYNKINNV
jgi:hypothetical protein